MHPVLFPVGNVPIRTYGVLLVLGVILAAWIAQRRAPRFGIQPDRIWDAVMWLVIPGIIGARITYIVQNWSYYVQHQDQLWTLRFEGLTSFGGLLFGFLGFLVWQRRTKTPFWSFLDMVGVPVLVAQAVGRVGCLFNGCCYGRPTDAWYGVHFEGLTGNHVPAQIVDTFLMLVGALVLSLWERKASPKPGASFGWFLVAYGASRFVYEVFRAGTKAEMASGIASSAYLPGLPITSAQLVTFILMALGVVCVLASRNRQPQSVAEAH